MSLFGVSVPIWEVREINSAQPLDPASKCFYISGGLRRAFTPLRAFWSYQRLASLYLGKLAVFRSADLEIAQLYRSFIVNRNVNLIKKHSSFPLSTHPLNRRKFPKIHSNFKLYLPLPYIALTANRCRAY